MHGLEAVRIEHLGREALIQRGEPIGDGVLEPVVGVDDVEVVAGLDDPSVARLPPQNA